jgi:hypothetical protein
MDGPGAPDRVWRSIKDLAAQYSRLPAPPPVDEMERDLQMIIHENLGRDIDRRLIAFYIRELQELTADARRSRITRGEIESDKNGSGSAPKAN